MVLALFLTHVRPGTTVNDVLDLCDDLGAKLLQCRIDRRGCATIGLDDEQAFGSRLQELANSVRGGRYVTIELPRKSGNIVSVKLYFPDYKPNPLRIEYSTGVIRDKIVCEQETRILPDGQSCSCYILTLSLQKAPSVHYEVTDDVLSEWKYDPLAIHRRQVVSLDIAWRPINADTFFVGDLEAAPRKIFKIAADFGNCLDHRYFLQFPRNSQLDKKFGDALARLDDAGLLESRAIKKVVEYDYKAVETEIWFPILSSERLTFDVKFMLMSLLTHDIITIFSLTRELENLLEGGGADVINNVLESIFNEFRKKRIYAFYEEVKLRMGKAQYREKKRTDFVGNINKFLARKIVVTPLKCYFKGPFVEVSNRVIRNYKAHEADFVRISFAREDLEPLGGGNADKRKMLALYQRVRAVLNQGIWIDNRQFEFLLYSNSQLRTCGCWFFADSKLLAGDDIRSQMGRFNMTRNPAKLASRMAQVFSSSQVTGKLEDIDEIPDVERLTIGPEGRTYLYNFSDGVGRIGIDVADNIMRRLKLPRLPSALQFRMAGAKGVLALCKGVCREDAVEIRPSQKKFDSSHLSMEVIRHSFNSVGYLNHQYIILLETLGIPSSTFMALKDEMTKALDQMMVDPEIAKQMISDGSATEGLSSIPLLMIENGFFEDKEPFLFNLLHLAKAVQLKDLKKKGKIRVQKSANLLGIMDEHNVLPPETIFLQIYDDVKGISTVIKGKVIIGRSPSLHPGDVRLVDAIDAPELAYLEDVVVFSQQGDRPLPNMLSGGDLDGDTFFVSWEQRLFIVNSAPPMIFDSQGELEIGENVITVEHIKDHFVRFIQQNNLGTIANAWKAVADDAEDNAFNENALELAELHSCAVDFPKKGISAEMKRELIPRFYPDFMDKPDKPSYPSRKAAGLIYRSINVNLDINCDFEPEPKLLIPGWQEYEESARLNREQYNIDLIKVMNQFNVASELEIVSGFFFKITDDFTKWDKERIKRAREAMSELMKSYRRTFFLAAWHSDDARAKAESIWAATEGGVFPARQKCPTELLKKVIAAVPIHVLEVV
ncbi:hypothetical protein HK101_011452 [Irineochytrium annulatum]|nr:hypothetical protein HK101_011452 [Irineochytrium annulatum]